MRRLLAAVMVLGLALIVPSAQARDATVRSFDQTPINTHFFPAAGLAVNGMLRMVAWSRP